MNAANENHLRETEEILREFPETRDDDALLWVSVCCKFHTTDFVKMQGAQFENFIDLFRRLPKIDSIKRYRRTLREKYPSSEEAEERRRKQEEESKHFYAANGQGSFLPPSFNMQHD